MDTESTGTLHIYINVNNTFPPFKYHHTMEFNHRDVQNKLLKNGLLKNNLDKTHKSLLRALTQGEGPVPLVFGFPGPWRIIERSSCIL